MIIAVAQEKTLRRFCDLVAFVMLLHVHSFSCQNDVDYYSRIYMFSHEWFTIFL